MLLETPAITLSTFKPSKDSVKEVEGDRLFLKLAPGEVRYGLAVNTSNSNIYQRLVILGQFEISLQRGQITLLGATLQPSKSKYRVFVPLSHSLPVIRCLATELDEAEICLYQCETGLEHLKSLSPLFGRLWNDGCGPLGHEQSNILKQGKSSFRIVCAFDVPLR